MDRIARYAIGAALLIFMTEAASAQKLIGDAEKELADQISLTAVRQGKHRIAVIPFRELDGRTTVLGTYLAEEIVTRLVETGVLDVIERSLLDKVMAELKLSHSGAVDPESARHLGRIIGAEAIVTGSITDLQSYVGVNCRLIDTETGRIFGAAQTRIVKDTDMQKSLKSQWLKRALDALKKYSPASGPGSGQR
jgi:curli biogenesis system outer membrane secretion channel CsgG